MGRIGHLVRGVGRILAWLPVLWKDDDYDFYWLCDIVEFKLSRMEKVIGAGCHKFRDRDARRIREVIEHLKRYRNSVRYCNYRQKCECPHWSITYGDCGCPSWYDKHDTAWFKTYYEIESWHWNEIWRKIGKYGRQWWD